MIEHGINNRFHLSLKEERFEVVGCMADDRQEDGWDVGCHYDRKQSTSKKYVDLI